MGAARADAGAELQLQLEELVGCGRSHDVEFLLQNLRRKRPQVVEFLEALVRHIQGPLLLVWDGLPAHRSRLVRDHIDGLAGRIHLEYLPGYAPELNPVEYIWSYWKQHELANVCPKDYWQLNDVARNALRRMRRRPRLVGAFWKQSSLCLD